MIPNIRAPKGFRFKVTSEIYDYNDNLSCGCCCRECCQCPKSKKDKPILSYKINLYAGHNYIGDVDLVPSEYNKNEYLTHSYLNADYRNKRLGTLMYAKAIQWCLKRNKRVRSSGESSEDAQRLWKSKSLRKYFYIRKTFDSKYDRECGDDLAIWRAYEKRI